MKALKSKSLMSLIYAVLLALPLCAILSRVIYVQSNKNAYQSYYGETINQTIETNVSFDSLQVNKDYKVIVSSPFNDTTATAFDIYTTNNNVKWNGTEISDIEYIRFYIDNQTTPYFLIRKEGAFSNYVNLKQNSLTIEFNYNNMTIRTEGNNTIKDCFYSVSYNNYSYLDNVFEYSVSQFVSENDFGQLNFFQWYDELLLRNNSHNALYIHFANWYLNYAMLISLMQILFLVLMWFVNFARKLLDRGMNYDW